MHPARFLLLSILPRHLSTLVANADFPSDYPYVRLIFIKIAPSLQRVLLRRCSRPELAGRADTKRSGPPPSPCHIGARG